MSSGSAPLPGPAGTAAPVPRRMAARGPRGGNVVLRRSPPKSSARKGAGKGFGDDLLLRLFDVSALCRDGRGDGMRIPGVRRRGAAGEMRGRAWVRILENCQHAGINTIMMAVCTR